MTKAQQTQSNLAQWYADGLITQRELIKALSLKGQGAPYLGEYLEALELKAQTKQKESKQ